MGSKQVENLEPGRVGDGLNHHEARVIVLLDVDSLLLWCACAGERKGRRPPAPSGIGASAVMRIHLLAASVVGIVHGVRHRLVVLRIRWRLAINTAHCHARVREHDPPLHSTSGRPQANGRTHGTGKGCTAPRLRPLPARRTRISFSSRMPRH